MNMESNHRITDFDGTLKELPVSWKWLLALGIFMLLAGSIGLGMTFVLTLASIVMFGILIGTAGLLQLIQGIQAKEKQWLGRSQHFLIALLYIVTGGIAIWDPVAASAGLTLVISALFAAMGVTKIVYAVRCQRRNWQWVLPVLSGLISLILAGLIFFTWPQSGLWVIGLFVAIELIMNGWFLTFLALRVKKEQTAQP